MSYTVTQKATTPNAAYTRLIYTVSGSTKVSQPQFSYLVDIYESGSTDRLQRIVQGVNPAGVSIFDPSRLFQGELKEDQSWKISSVTPYVSSSKTFTLEFGEQYGTSASSSIAVSSSIRSENIEVIRNVVEPNNGISYNWQSSSYAVLSNMPATMSMQFDDYGTISVYDNDVSYVSQSFYSASNTGTLLVQEKNYSITDSFSSVPISASTPYWNYAEVNVSSSLGINSYRYEVSDETHREKTRFAFINKLGTWDYYNNYNPVRQELSVLREQYTAARVDYSSLTSTYDISRKGLTSYHSTADDTFMVDTDYLDKTNANWLEELLESPSVFIQRDGEFMPIIITDSSYTANTNQARQKLFQYVITFRPSNQPFGKWEPEYVSCPKFQPKPPLVITNDFTGMTSTTFNLNGAVITDGGVTVTERGFAYSSQSANPSITGSTSVKVNAGTGIGNFTSNIISASEETTYYARAFASNSMALVYGDIKQANTLPFDPPEVSTQPMTGIDSGSLTFNGTAISQGGDPTGTFGFVYNTGSNPVITDNIITVTGPLGTYSSSLDGLPQGVTYYARAYASNSAHLVYGENQEATTTAIDVPNVVIVEASSGDLLKSTQFGYNVGFLSESESPVSEQGLVFSSTNANPNISSSDSTVISQSTNIGDSGGVVVAYPVSGSTTYYIKGYAINYAGAGYGALVTQLTPADFNPTTASLSNPYVHYDFTRPRNINNGVFDRSLLSSQGEMEIDSVSGSTYNSLGILTKGSANRPPNLQTNISPNNSVTIAAGPYASFKKINCTQGNFLAVAANAVDNIFWKGGTGVSNNITSYTVAAFLQPVYNYTDDGSAMISWDGIETGGGSPITSPAVDYASMKNNLTSGSTDIYGGAFGAIQNKGQIGIEAGVGGTSTRNVYSYSGSAAVGTSISRPWLSQYVFVDKSGVGTNLPYTIQRGDGGPIGSGSFGQPDRDGAAADNNNAMKFALGGEAYTATGTATFNIAHLVIYSGSITQAQMTALNRSLELSDPLLGLNDY